MRAGIYDDYPDFYTRVPRPFQILGYDAAGIVEARGPHCSSPFVPGDAVYYCPSPTGQGAQAELQLVDERAVAHKPRRADFVQAASMPLTWLTAYEALIERLKLPRGGIDPETGDAGALLIINGAGGVGCMASQLARHVLGLPAVVTTAGRVESMAMTARMGATHVLNHRDKDESLDAQVARLQHEKGLPPVRWVFITHSTDQYLMPVSRLCAPFARVCTIVQSPCVGLRETEFMSKSLALIWCVIGTRDYHGITDGAHGRALEELATYIDERKIQCHLTLRLPLDVSGLREGHRRIEEGRMLGKLALGLQEEGMTTPFS